MSESCKEQYPLLCDDVSEEEQFSPHYQRRFRPMIYRGRARNQAKGATAIITHWPDHWTSSAKYWWIGLGMITFTIFVLYNSVNALALLPSTHIIRPSKQPAANKLENLNERSPLPAVFMHILINSNEEVNLNNYLPNIETLTNKYWDFKYNLIIVVNDTSETDTLSAEEHNDIAFNSLWSKERILEKKKIIKNIHIQHVTLSSYMNTSPLKKDWRHLPHHFMEFLVKAISIWDKGGIAFNPNILSPQSAQHAIYAEKLENIFQKYRKCNEKSSVVNKINKHLNIQNEKQKKRVNNIQDIIDILEHEEGSFNSTQHSLTEAENRNAPINVHSGRKILSTQIGIKPNNNTETEQLVKIATGQEDLDDKIHTEIRNEKQTSTEVNEANNQLLKKNIKNKLGILPLFLEFLFHDKDTLHTTSTEETIENNIIRRRKSAINLDSLKKNVSTISVESATKSNKKFGGEYNPMIISAKGIIQYDTIDKNINTNNVIECERTDHLTIDLKGNILSTQTACHAFIGSVFSNVIHYTKEETLNDLIIAELSGFCKGLLSSCKGIDVILL